MSIWKHRGSLALGVFFLITIGGVLFLVVNYRTAMGELRADHDKGVELIREFLSVEPVRPVLRGEALPGNGGPKLAEILDVIESEQPKPPFALLLRDARGDVDAESKPKVEEAFAYGRKFLPEVREALQHEYCRLPLDYVGLEWREYFPIRERGTLLVGLLLYESRDLASKGQFKAALRNVSDAIRLSHDLGRGTGVQQLRLAGYIDQRAAVEFAARLLHEHPFPPEALEAWLAEVRLLQSTWPADENGTVVEEYRPVIELYLWHVGRLTGQPEDIGAKAGFLAGLLYMGGLHLEEYHAYFEDYRRLLDLEFSKAEAALPEFRKLGRKMGGMFPGPGNPIRAKQATLLHEMELACLEAGVLAHIYYASHNGAWPETLSQCGDIPLDPWDGKPLRYKPPGEGKPAFVYSIFKNWRDDGGEAETAFLGKLAKNADYVFPLGPWPEPEQKKSK